MITVFYDGKCGLCRREIEHYKNIAPQFVFNWVDITVDKSALENLGINYVEMLRIDLADGEITSNQFYDKELISEMPVCGECNMPISECESCNGSGYEEPDSSGTYLEPYPCLKCSPWNGDPEDMEYWSDVHQSWISGVGVGCTTEDCPGSRLPTMLEIEISPKYMIEKQTLSKYVQEKLGFYVYALRDPRDMKVFYVGKGVGERFESQDHEA